MAIFILKSIGKFPLVSIIESLSLVFLIVRYDHQIIYIMVRTFIILLGFISAQSFAQDPTILWENTIGGNSWDSPAAMINSANGGYVLVCNSESGISGDKTENNVGGNDIWVFELDSEGNIIWQNTIGGNDTDRARSIFQTTDGGYLLGGDSRSNSSGDKTENSRGGYDFWVVKIDAAGLVEWDKTLGGDDHDVLTSAIQNSNDEFIVTGLSWSNISGDKTENNVGLTDIWVLKLSNSGSIIWQNTIGGSDLDLPAQIIEAIDGGYVIVASSDSNASGDKTDDSEGERDLWVIKIDEAGALGWQNTIGGSDLDSASGITIGGTDGYLVLGDSKSDASGDKSENSMGLQDYWIVKLDLGGNIVWQNTIGGEGSDVPSDVTLLENGGYLVTGWSTSLSSGDKDEDSVGLDYWVVRTDAQGIINGQNTFTANDFDSSSSVIEDANGDFLVAGQSRSGISGDKSEALIGVQDNWVIKFSNFLGVSENKLSNGFIIYPNPTSGILTIDNPLSVEYTSVRLLDMLGRELEKFKTSTNNNGQEIDISKIQSGVYFIEIAGVNFKTSARIIKQ